MTAMAKVTLTKELAEDLSFYWQLVGDKLTDEEICYRIGIKFGQLRGWLQRNTRPRLPDGKKGKEGLRDIRNRAKVSTMTGYLAELNRDARDAQTVGDRRTSSTIWMWLLEKQFPTKFGNRINVESAQSPAELVRGMLNAMDEYHQLCEPGDG